MNHGIRADPGSAPGSGGTPVNWLPASASILTPTNSNCVSGYPLPAAREIAGCEAANLRSGIRKRAEAAGARDEQDARSLRRSGTRRTGPSAIGDDRAATSLHRGGGGPPPAVGLEPARADESAVDPQKMSVGQPAAAQDLVNRRARSAAMIWASRSINSSSCGLRTGPFASVVSVGVKVRARRTASSTWASSLIKARTEPPTGTASSNARVGDGI